MWQHFIAKRKAKTVKPYSVVNRAAFFLLLIAPFLFPVQGLAKDSNILISSVSPEFQNGLQFKQLQYLAAQLNLELEIRPMPFARRLNALKRGDIDLMIALKQGHDTEQRFTYLLPSYESIETSLFVNEKQDVSNVNRASFILGVTVDNNYELVESLYAQSSLVKVNTLQQKVSLLKNKRIHGFLHLKQSANALLQHEGLVKSVRAVKVPELESTQYFIGISHISPHYAKKEQIEKLIVESKEKGVFTKLRQQHYAQNLVN